MWYLRLEIPQKRGGSIMNIKDQLKAQSQQVATGRQNYADFYKRTDKMIDANMVANQIIEVITSGISSDINSRNYKSYYNNFFYEGITNTQFELHLYDDGLPGVKEYSPNRKAYDIYSLKDIDNIYSILKKELSKNFKYGYFFKPSKNFGICSSDSTIDLFHNEAGLSKFIKKGVKACINEQQKRPGTDLSTIIINIQTVARIGCDKNGVIK